VQVVLAGATDLDDLRTQAEATAHGTTV
jgi:hypothetical protein